MSFVPAGTDLGVKLLRERKMEIAGNCFGSRLIFVS
jgi:hypothetical protein